jgi:hypothetical protein
MEAKQLDSKYVGSLSSATMRAEDLIPEFSNFLDSVPQNWPYAEPQESANALEVDSDGYYTDVESADYILEDLFNALNEIAPEDCYFGSHPGDGADYGFWPSEDSDLWE